MLDNKLKKKDGAPTLTNTRMIKAIAGTDLTNIESYIPSNDSSDKNPSTESVIKAILEKSFLPHQKGVKREHCSLGHRLERPILRKFTEIIPEINQYNGIKIKTAYTVGLAAKAGNLYAKDSIDFVLSVEDPKCNAERTLWGFEAKGRVTVETAGQEEMNITLDANPHIRISADEVCDLVSKVSERF